MDAMSTLFMYALPLYTTRVFWHQADQFWCLVEVYEGSQLPLKVIIRRVKGGQTCDVVLSTHAQVL